MKKTIAIYILFSFLISNTELHQLLKLPVLIHHYIEHQDQDQGISFSQFLSKHYNSEENHADTGHNDHKNLPFKTNDCTSIHVSVAAEHKFVFSICHPNIASENISTVYNEIFYSSAILNKIWQPPQFS